MTTFRVWAPDKRTVDLQLGNMRIPMERIADWWQVDVAEARAGADYAFVVEGSPPLPDPRAAWQPSGVHGLSRVVDHDAFAWSDRVWAPPALEGGVLYELHVGTFTPAGTFAGVIQQLDHLVALGVTHVELMPVHEFPGCRGWGYDGVDLFAPHHAYGGPVGLKALVDACHGHGLAVILDVVYNHLGPDGNYLASFGPYFTDRYRTPWGSALNLDGAGSHEVRRLLCDNALMWLRDYHIDGLRIDAVHALIDTSAIHLLEQLADEVDALQANLERRLILIAESDLNDPRVVRPRVQHGYGLDAQWNDDFHHALHAVLTGERHGYYADFGTLSDIAAALQQAFVYGGRYSAFRRRYHGRMPTGLSGHRFLGYLQTHDQVGNRAAGERSSHLMTPARLKIGAALVFTAPFIPMLFQGEEWGASSPFLYFTDHQDVDLARRISEGRRRELAAFGWDPSVIPDPRTPATFDQSVLRWQELREPPHAELLNWYRELVRLRQRTPALRDGDLGRVEVRFDERDKWLILQRGAITVACNFSRKAQRIALRSDHSLHVLLASEHGIAITRNGISLPPESVGVFGPPD